MTFVDIHCHLDHAQFEQDTLEVIARTQKSKTICITHGTGEESNQKALALADQKTVFVACGQDAFHAQEDMEEHLRFLEKNKARLSAVGEIGLDQHYFTKEHLIRQKEVFQAQLEFAEKSHLAVVVHTRKAIAEVLEILPSYKCPKVLHYFLEKKFTQQALSQDCYPSLPTVKSKDRVAIIKQTPLDRLLCETDAPFSWKGRNEPQNVREVYEEVSHTVKKPLEDIEKQIELNARKVFKL